VRVSAGTRIAVLGCGNWGRNHVRVFANLAECELVAVADPSPQALARAQSLAPNARVQSEPAAILGDPSIDAVVIATPAPSHAELAIAALGAGKHVLVEKPLALDQASAQAVADAAARAGRTLAVGHILLHHPALERLREMLVSGELGELFYLYSRRVNLGQLRRDENALWSFAPHDLSMIDYLLGELPLTVSARGECYLQKGIEDVVFVNLRFAGGQMANIHLSWLDPRKERRLTVVCSKKMVEFDDVAREKLRIYDKGYEKPPEFSHFDEYLSIREGDIHMPHVPMREPLIAQAKDFLAAIRDGRPPRADAASALRVVKVLAAAQASLERDGEPVQLG